MRMPPNEPDIPGIRIPRDPLIWLVLGIGFLCGGLFLGSLAIGEIRAGSFTTLDPSVPRGRFGPLNAADRDKVVRITKDEQPDRFWPPVVGELLCGGMLATWGAAVIIYLAYHNVKQASEAQHEQQPPE